MLKTEAFYLEFLIAVLEDSIEECERGNTPSKPGNVPKREEVLLVCSDLGGWDNAHPICVKRYPTTASPAVYSSRDFHAPGYRHSLQQSPQQR